MLTWLRRRPALLEVAIPALSLLFGLEVLRVVAPGLIWTLGDRFGFGPVELAAVALAVFAAAFLAGAARRWLGGWRAMVLAAGGLGLLRLVIQSWWDEPMVNLVLAMLATALFAIYLSLGLRWARGRGGASVGRFALGILAGLALDTTLHSAMLTYDAIWRPGFPAILLPVALVGLQWLFLATVRGARENDADGRGRVTLAWAAIGPFLFLEMVVLQNVARTATLTGWQLPTAGGWLVVTHLAALAGVVWWLSRSRARAWPLAAVAGAALVAVTALPASQPVWAAAVMVLVAQVAASLLLAVIVTRLPSPSGGASGAGLTVAGGVGMVLLMLLLFGYYVVYQISLPYSNDLLELVAAVLLALGGLRASLAGGGPAVVAAHGPRLVRALSVLAVVLIVPWLLVWRTPVAAPDGDAPLRVMTYNLHSGFNTGGHLDLEQLASVIEESRPDILALQEVSRGWFISGRTDMLGWLSHRLGMPYVSGPTADAYWGNAVLSRYPITGYENHQLPPRDLSILRGFTRVGIDLGEGRELQIIATHFHHIEEDSAIRVEQARAIIDYWNGAGDTIILGDFNAEPDSTTMQMLFAAGLVDAAALRQSSPSDTFHADAPFQRIDYVLVSPDLAVGEVFVPATTASDHLPVIAVISK